MDSVVEKEVKPVTFEKVVVGFEAPEAQALSDLIGELLVEGSPMLKLLNPKSTALLTGLKDALDNPKQATTVVKRATPTETTPEVRLDDIDPKAPDFKARVLARLKDTYILPNVRTVADWKKEAVAFVQKSRKDITTTPATMEDNDFFDWLVSIKLIDETGQKT